MVSMTPITNEHLVVMQKIVNFVQDLGWDIQGVDISRYSDSDGPFGETDGEEWKGKSHKWYLALRTSPRDEEELEKKVKV